MNLQALFSQARLDAPQTRRAAGGLAGVFALVILIACLLPGEDLPSMKITDKTQHFIAYAGLMGPLGIAFGRAHLVRATLMAMLYGGAVEVAQAIVPTGRSASWLDAGANGLGALLGAACLVVVFKRVGRRPI